MARVGKIHVINNYYNCAGNATACINPRKNSEFLIEGNYFASGISKVYSESDAKAATWDASNVIARNGVAKPDSKGSTVTVPYEYTIQPATDMPEILTAHAGATLFRGVPSGISHTTLDPSASSAVYNLAGQRVGASAKGILIRNGKKYVVK